MPQASKQRALWWNRRLEDVVHGLAPLFSRARARDRDRGNSAKDGRTLTRVRLWSDTLHHERDFDTRKAA